MSDFCSSEEVDPVALAESIHIERVLPLNFVCVPEILEDTVTGGAFKFSRGHVGHLVFVFWLAIGLPMGSMILLMSKWCL